MKIKGKNVNNTIKYLILFFIFVALSFVLILTFNNATKYSLKNLTIENQETRIEGGSYILKNEVETHISLLRSFSNNISDLKNFENTSAILVILNQMLNSSKFNNAYYIKRNGELINEIGVEENVSDRDYFIKAVNGEASIERVVGKIVHEARIMIAVPVFDGDSVVGVLVGSYSEDNFNTIIKAATSSSEGIYLVIEGNGQYVCGYSTYEDVQIKRLRSENYFDVIRATEYTQKDFDEEAFIASISGNGKGSFESQFDGKRYFLSYTPVGVSNWELLSYVSTDYNDKFADATTRNAWIALLVLIAIFTGILLFIVFNDRKSVKILNDEKEHLRVSEERYKIVEKMSDSVIFECDYVTDTVKYTENFFNVFHRNPELVKAEDFLGEDAKYMHLHPDDRERTRQLVKNMKNEPVGSFEYRKMEKDGFYHWYKMRYAVIFASTGEKVKVIGKMINIDQQKRETLELIDKADRDSLTQIFNHEAFRKKATAYLSEKEQKEKCAMLILDIDDFKSINDKFGHLEGDNALKRMTALLTKSFKGTDIIGRLGGDEFAILMKNISGELEVSQKAAEIVSIARDRRKKGKQDGTISVGISIYDDVIKDFDELYKTADTALYEAKLIGKDRYSIYKKV